jgi:hypothetical protein
MMAANGRRSSGAEISSASAAQIVHIAGLFTTLAHVGGADVPKDRPIDGVEQFDFFLGKQQSSNGEGFPAYARAGW